MCGQRYVEEVVETRLGWIEYCSIGQGTPVLFLHGGHSNCNERLCLKGFDREKYQVVGNDVWIGYDSLIMPGVTIGDGAIIAARSVVVKDVAPYTVVGGNPAKEIRKRFDEETIDLLERVRWWDWPAEKITRHLELLTSNDLPALRRFLEHNM